MLISAHKFIFTLMLVIGVFASAMTFAQTSAQTYLSQEQQEVTQIPIALGGNDVVSYFSASGRKKGSEDYQAAYNEKRYLFASMENRAKFAADPEQYLPEFDEYCGCALSDNRRAIADPNVYKIVNGKLFLFQDNDALAKWNKNENERLATAQKYYKYESHNTAGDRLRDDSRVRLFSFKTR